jgi:hypothetical protein
LQLRLKLSRAVKNDTARAERKCTTWGMKKGPEAPLCL